MIKDTVSEDTDERAAEKSTALTLCFKLHGVRLIKIKL